MRASTKRPAGRLHFVLLSLTFGLATALAGGAAPSFADDERKVSLEAKWLVVRSADLGQFEVQLPDKVTSDTRGQITIRQYVPDYGRLGDTISVPNLVLDKVYLANDIGTAQQIFQQESNAGFAEATVPVACVGGMNLPGYGDQSSGIGGRNQCDGNTSHFRITFRYLNAVHVLYLYGNNQYVYEEVALNLARLLDERVRAVPSYSGPPADQIYSVSPREICLSADDAGKEVDTAANRDGGDDRSQWCEVRFSRPPQKIKSHLGPLDMYNKVWVARDLETAHAIYTEQARQGYFPEAATGGNGTTQEVGDGQFAMQGAPGIGNENFGWSACNENCNSNHFLYLHHRYVTRIGNVVAIVYIWGGNQETTVDQVNTYAQSIRGHIH